MNPPEGLFFDSELGQLNLMGKYKITAYAVIVGFF